MFEHFFKQGVIVHVYSPRTGRGGKRSEVEGHPCDLSSLRPVYTLSPQSGEEYERREGFGIGNVDLLPLLQIRRNQRDMCQVHI